MRLLRLAAAVLLGAALPMLLRLPWSDPFATTLVVLPFVVVALAELARWARGARAPTHSAQRVAAAELAVLVGLVALVCQRSRLGFTAAEPLLLGGFLLLLARRVAVVLLRSRRHLGTALGSRPPAAFFWLPFVVYLALLPWNLGQRPPDGDEPYYLLLAHSLAYDLDVDLANNYADDHSRSFLPRSLGPQPGDPAGSDGALYSRHTALLPLVLALPYRLAGRWGASLVMAAVTAALCWWTLRLARHHHRDRPGAALLAYSLLAFTPPLLTYSNQIWVEVPAALLVAIAIDGVLDAQRGLGRRPLPALVLLVLPLLALPLLKARFLPIAVMLAALAVRRREGIGRLLPLAALAAAAGASVLLNQWLFAKSFRVYSVGDLLPGGLSAEQVVGGLLGPFFDVAFGLFACSPLWLLLLPAALLLVRRERAVAADLAVVALPYLALLASRREWYGGWSPPFRYGIVLLPLLALSLPPLLAQRRRAGARALVAALAIVTFALVVAWTTVPGWTYNFADGSSHLLDRLCRRYEIDLVRFFPSFVRPRLASWWWPLAAAIGGLAWWVPRPARHGRRIGLAALCLSFAALFAAGWSLPTRIVEAEDAWVRHPSGRVYPKPWTPDRTRYDGGWRLEQGARLEVPVVAGGDEVEIVLRVDPRPLRARRLMLRLRAGGSVLARRTLEPEAQAGALRFGPFPWRRGDALSVEVGKNRAVRKGSVIVDRVELQWR